MRDGLRKGEERTALTATTTTATTIAMPRSHLDIFRKTDYFLVTSLGPLIDSSLHGILTNGPWVDHWFQQYIYMSVYALGRGDHENMSHARMTRLVVWFLVFRRPSRR